MEEVRGMIGPMSQLVKVLECARAGQVVPEELFRGLSPHEQDAVRAFENDRQGERQWRDVALSIMTTATDLSRGQDWKKVLEELVERARWIIRSDVAYISLNDLELGVTRVLMTSGVATEAFRNVKIPLGTGVLGRVATTKQAAWTYDQSQDPNITRDPEVDEVVRMEGVRGILGAPLVRDGEIIGTLMVGDRRQRYYTADEIIVLDSLASLASVALETSKLITDLEENVVALEHAHSQSKQQIEQLRTLSEVDSRLMDVLSKGANPSDIRQVIRETLDCEAWFWHDDRPYPVGKEQPADNLPVNAAHMKNLIARSQETGEIAIEENMSVLAISLRQRRLGTICINRAVEEPQAPILHRAAQTFATIILFREALIEAESRQVNDLLRKVVAGSAGDEDFTRIKKMSGVDLRAGESMHLAAIVSEGALPNARTLDRLIGDQGLVFEHGDHLCVLTNTFGRLEETLDKIFNWARESENRLYVGVSPLSSLRERAPEIHSRSRALAGSMRSLNVPHQVATATTYGSLGLLLNADRSTIDQIIIDGIGKLVTYDEKHHTELTKTADQYFDCSRSAAHTAKILFLHENTVRQRIDRITEILGVGWNSGARAFDIQLALRAWKIVDRH